MAVPDYGAAPLSKTFLIIRVLQFLSFIGIIGITANFIAEIVSANHIAPSAITGTVAVTSIACLYCLISIPFFWARANIGLLVMCLIDFFLLIAFVVVSFVLGKPLATLDCSIIGGPTGLLDSSSAWDFTQTLGSSVNEYGNFVLWSGATRANCYESKAAWGMCIGLCILFTSSVFVLPALFAKQKRAAKTADKGYA